MAKAKPVHHRIAQRPARNAYMLDIHYRDGRVQQRRFVTTATMLKAIEHLKPTLVRSYSAWIALAERTFAPLRSPAQA